MWEIKCDGCGNDLTNGFEEEHIYPPDFTFYWCGECAKNDNLTGLVIFKARES